MDKHGLHCRMEEKTSTLPHLESGIEKFSYCAQIVSFPKYPWTIKYEVLDLYYQYNLSWLCSIIGLVVGFYCVQRTQLWNGQKMCRGRVQSECAQLKKTFLTNSDMNNRKSACQLWEGTPNPILIIHLVKDDILVFWSIITMIWRQSSIFW